MATKKNFIPAYDPPRVVRASDRWYISFYASDENGVRKKYRPTFNLSRIHNLKEREARAQEIISKLKYWLESGKPIHKFDERKVRVTAAIAEEFPLLGTPVRVALDHVVKLKSALREDSERTYKSGAKLFLDYMVKQGWGEMEIGDVSKVHAKGYLDDCIITRELSPTSWNNQMSVLRTLFNELRDRGYIQDNPFGGIKKKKELPKARRIFTVEEARIVLRRVREESDLLFYICLLQYCCHFRPGEIQKMRFRDIDLKTGLVRLDFSRTKDWDNRVATIPEEFREYFPVEFFTSYPANTYIFGAGFRPGLSKPVSKQVAFRLHEKILQDLLRRGELSDITGLVLYSWKDTGITHALENLPLLAVQDQAGHSNGQITLKYRHKEPENKAYKQGFLNKVLL